VLCFFGVRCGLRLLLRRRLLPQARANSFSMLAPA